MKKLFLWSVTALLLLLAVADAVFAKTLVITDSHGEGAFGEELVSLIENQNESVSMFAVGGSSSADWNHGLQQIWGYWEHHTGQPNIRSTKPVTPRLKVLLETVKPDRLIIELGTNLIWREIPEQSKAEIDLMLATVRESGVKCYWVGPPDLRPNMSDRIPREIEIQKLLEQKVPGNGCTLVKSWEFTHFPEQGGDGIHYDTVPFSGKSLSRQWANGVVSAISQI